MAVTYRYESYKEEKSLSRMPGQQEILKLQRDEP